MGEEEEREGRERGRKRRGDEKSRMKVRTKEVRRRNGEGGGV